MTIVMLKLCFLICSPNFFIFFSRGFELSLVQEAGVKPKLQNVLESEFSEQIPAKYCRKWHIQDVIAVVVAKAIKK